MRRVIAIAVLVGFIALAVPGSPVVGEAEAREDPLPECIQEPCQPCIIGSQDHCIVKIVCVREPCP